MMETKWPGLIPPETLSRMTLGSYGFHEAGAILGLGGGTLVMVTESNFSCTPLKSMFVLFI